MNGEQIANLNHEYTFKWNHLFPIPPLCICET